MDAQARKLFRMLGSAYAGERHNAFDRLDKYLEGKGLTLPKLWDGLETELAAATADIANWKPRLPDIGVPMPPPRCRTSTCAECCGQRPNSRI